jgi:hypothetical protein
MSAAGLGKGEKSKRRLNAEGSEDGGKLYICSLENMMLTNLGRSFQSQSDLDESSKENEQPQKKKQKDSHSTVHYICLFIVWLLTFFPLGRSKSSAQIKNLNEAKVAVRKSKMPPLPEGLTTVAGIDLASLASGAQGLKFDDETRKSIVFWMVENKCTEPQVGGRHLEFLELQKKIGFEVDGLPNAYKLLLQDRLRRDMGILKKQLISTQAIGVIPTEFKKGNKPDPTYFFPFTSRWILPAYHPRHLPFDINLTWDPEIVAAVNGDLKVLNAASTTTELLPYLDDEQRIAMCLQILQYPPKGFKGFPESLEDQEDSDNGEGLMEDKTTVKGSFNPFADPEVLQQTAADGM